MIKSILQVMAFYIMSIFQLPTSLINTIEKMMNLFWPWVNKVEIPNFYFLALCGLSYF